MKTCGEIRDWFNERWPESLACQWDNVGLLVGRAGKEIQKIYVTLDVTDEDVAAAVSMGADMILSHHPLIFGPVKRINDADPQGRRLLTLIREDICCYGGHTCTAESVKHRVSGLSIMENISHNCRMRNLRMISMSHINRIILSLTYISCIGFLDFKTIFP